LAIAIERGDISQMSCGFCVQDDTWSIGSDGVEERDVHSFSDLFDVSAVGFAASPSTSIELTNRALMAAGKETRDRLRRTFAVGAELRKDAPATVTVKGEPLVYGEGSEASFIQDLWRVRADQTGQVPRRDKQPELALRRLTRNQAQQAYIGAHGTAEEKRLLRGQFVERNRPVHGMGEMDPTEREWKEFLEFRDDSTGSMSLGSFTPPVYSLARWQKWRTAASPVASHSLNLPLPGSGMIVYEPRLTSQVEVGVQSAENGSIATSSPTATYAEADVQTVTGGVSVSQQYLDRAGPGIEGDDVIAQQAMVQVGTELDILALQALLQGGTAKTYVNNAAPTVSQLWHDIGIAAAFIEDTEGTRLSPTHAFLAPPQMRFYQAQVGSDGRPVWLPNPSGGNAVAGEVATADEGNTGYQAFGCELFTDSNLSAASAGFVGGVVADLPHGLAVYLGAPLVEVVPEFQPATLTAFISIRQYVAYSLRYGSSVVFLTGSAYSGAVLS
jgi:hypothetical protein